MICLAIDKLQTVDDARALLQTAVGVEFGTLPPYLYALYSIAPGTNAEASALIRSVALQEMIHMCLACNILNALGGNPVIQVQAYPGPLPGDIGPPPHDKPLLLNLLPFSKDAMAQAMAIEEPEDAPVFPIKTEMLAEAAPATKTMTIGQFYDALDKFLGTLPASVWTANRNQITDAQFFPGQLFAVHDYKSASKAIEQIVSEGEGTPEGTTYNPLDFQDQPAHYFRFGEIFHERVLSKDKNPMGYAWGPAIFPVTWPKAGFAISNPAEHDFSKEPQAVRDAQYACDRAFSAMIGALQRAVTGVDGALGDAVRAMFDLRMDALHAFTVKLNSGAVAGPAFVFIHPTASTHKNEGAAQ